MSAAKNIQDQIAKGERTIDIPAVSGFCALHLVCCALCYCCTSRACSQGLAKWRLVVVVVVVLLLFCCINSCSCCCILLLFSFSFFFFFFVGRETCILLTPQTMKICLCNIIGASGRQVCGEAREAKSGQEGAAEARPSPAAADDDLEGDRNGAEGHAQGRAAKVS